jgi:AcrR family transcriptional regulator
VGHREALLEGARKCLEQKGYARTTARDLVAASGTNLASIGYHFGSKDALLNEAIGVAFEEWTARVGDVAFATPGASPLERVATSWVALLDSLSDYRPLIVALFEAMAQAERSPELRRQLADHYAGARAQVARMIRVSLGGDAEGAGAVPEHVASFLIAVCDGLTLQWLLDPDGPPTGEQLVSSLGAALSYALTEEG